MPTKKAFYLLIILLGINSFPNSKRALQEDTRSDDIIILHTNDVHCGVQDTIGYDGLLLYKKQLEKKYKNIILADVGDEVQGGLLGTITDGEAIIEIMNEIGYDVVALGNHEFDYGVTQLNKLESLLNCSYISINYCLRKEKPKSVFSPYKIIEIGGKKIGFIGVTTPQALYKTRLFNEKDEDGELKYDFLSENKSQELYDQVQKVIDELRNTENCDYVIILGHLGIGGVALEENSSEGLLKKIKNIDAFLDGHSHLIYTKISPDSENKGVPLSQTGTKLTNIGILRIHSNGTITQEMIDEVPYDPELASETLNVTRSKKERYVDKSMNEYINQILDDFSYLLEELVGTVDFPLNVYATPEDRVDLKKQLSRRQENALCNLVADALKNLGNSDISIFNAGTVRGDIDAGNITFKNILDILPFSNDIYVKEIKGQTIIDALEFGVRSLPDSTSRFPQVSGLKYKIDLSINSTVEVDENEAFVKVNGERRVYDIEVNGEKIDPEKTYSICSNSFILDGGDGYSMFSEFEITKQGFGVDNEIVRDYIEKNLNGTVPEKYKEPEGRFINTNGKESSDTRSDDIPEEGNTTINDFIDLIGFGNFKHEKNKNAKVKAYFLGKKDDLKNLKKYLNFSVIINYDKVNLRNLEQETIYGIGEKNESEIENGKVIYDITFPNTEYKNIKEMKSNNDFKFSNVNTNITEEIKIINIDEDLNLTNPEDVKINYITPESIEKTDTSINFEFKNDNSKLKDNSESILKYLPKGESTGRLEIKCNYKKKDTDNNIITCYPKKDINSIINTWIIKIQKISGSNNNLRILDENSYEKFYLDQTNDKYNKDISFEYKPTPSSINYKSNILKKSKGLNGGAIAGIIIACLAVIIGVAITIILCKKESKKNINTHYYNDSMYNSQVNANN